jgi:hypothetical protein
MSDIISSPENFTTGGGSNKGDCDESKQIEQYYKDAWKILNEIKTNDALQGEEFPGDQLREGIDLLLILYNIVFDKFSDAVLQTELVVSLINHSEWLSDVILFLPDMITSIPDQMNSLPQLVSIVNFFSDYKERYNSETLRLYPELLYKLQEIKKFFDSDSVRYGLTAANCIIKSRSIERQFNVSAFNI